jgi:hypothetical protein
MPVTLDETMKLYPVIPDFFPSKYLDYINQLLVEIGHDEAAKRSNTITRNNHLSLFNKDKGAGDDSSERGSLPISRSSSNENFLS